MRVFGRQYAAGRVCTFAVVLSAAVLFALSSSAAGDYIAYITVEARSGDQAATQVWAFPATSGGQSQFVWSLDQPLILGGANGILGTVEGLTIRMDGDPGVSLGFQVTAGGLPTDFTVTSSTVAFTPINGVLAYCSAGVTVTDVDSNGATLGGLFAGNKIYQAQYNAGPLVWASLLDNVLCPVDQTAVSGARLPGLGRQVFATTVSSIQSQFKFSLTANDMASGTSRFDVIPIPEPATLTLLLLGGGLAAFIRRRRKA